MEKNITLVNNMENSFANTNSYRCVIGLYMESSEINILQNFQELHAMNLETSLKLKGDCYAHNSWST